MTSLIPSDGLMMSARRGGNKQAMHAGERQVFLLLRCPSATPAWLAQLRGGGQLDQQRADPIGLDTASSLTHRRNDHCSMLKTSTVLR